MKNVFLLFFVILLAASCTKQSAVEEPADQWNGYFKYLKAGELVKTLWAGKNINVGTVTYGIDENANFYATYDCSSSGWTISETHMYAGDKIDMPLNKPGTPKIGLFPNSGYHNPRVSTFTYYVPLTSLPPCEQPGFVVTAHCVVHSPSNQEETAWAEGDYTFTDKGWGWYDVYYYNQPPNEFTIIYGTSYTDGYLILYHVDLTNGTADPILQEFVGDNAGVYDGAAFDLESGMFFFANYNTKELWANQLKDEYPSFKSGDLIGTAASGTFYSGAYYYVDAVPNTINKVTFTTDFQIANEMVLSTIPNSVTVTDIAMSPVGDYLYILGEVDNGGMELISWNVATNTYYTMNIGVSSGTQMAYGSDGILYVIEPVAGGQAVTAYTVNTADGTLTVIGDGDIIIIDDPFSDIATGPIM
ncbi:MAG: hypothetical protein K0B08_09515 [Bacteroidales bacterium]|nr:hypothetical protein [Bacteroidales bacterium]